MKLDNINFLKQAKNIIAITEGHSGANKYIFTKNDKKYFLKIGNFVFNDNLENIFTKFKINHPKIIEIGKYSDNYNYIIEEYIEGQNLKCELDKLDSKSIYEFGFIIGKQYANLRKIFPDKRLHDNYIYKHKKYVMEKVEDLITKVANNKNILSKEIKSSISIIINYLSNNFHLFENSKLVFGHTDVKPSNFIISKRKIYAVDIEHTDYKELSLSLIWSYARCDFKDEKNLSFAKGYLDGLYNFDIPSNILKSFDYSYAFNIAIILIDYLKSKKIQKLEKFVSYINDSYIVSKKIIISKKLKNSFNIKKKLVLNGLDFNLIEGSYSPNNLTFKCSDSNSNYFFKVMKTSEKEFRKYINSYKLLKENDIPISPVIDCGACKYNELYYVITKYFDYSEMNKNAKNNTFETGFKQGNMVAEYLQRLKGKKCEGAKTFDKEDLYDEIIECLNIICKNNEYKKYITWNKRELINYINHYIKSFENESIDLIHGDVKFGNILCDGKDKIILVDNESLMYSFDVINFKYNIQNGFVRENATIYQGFVNGYLKYMNNGIIPNRTQEQIKLLLLYFLLRNIAQVLNKMGKDSEIPYFLNICEKYIKEKRDIEWLK